MKAIISGGSGQVGTILARALQQAGHEVVILSRRPVKGAWHVVEWDAQTLGDWTTVIEGADVVINLAGRSVNCRYNAENRRLIKESRVKSTRVLGDAIARSSRPPRVWLQASTATIYAHRYDAPNTETELLLKSRRVVPGALTQSKFIFQFPAWAEAARDLCNRRREARLTCANL